MSPIPDLSPMQPWPEYASALTMVAGGLGRWRDAWMGTSPTQHAGWDWRLMSLQCDTSAAQGFEQGRHLPVEVLPVTAVHTRLVAVRGASLTLAHHVTLGERVVAQFEVRWRRVSSTGQPLQAEPLVPAAALAALGKPAAVAAVSSPQASARKALGDGG